jgi:hypothetical protein
MVDAAGWQVRLQERELGVLIASPDRSFDPTSTERAVLARLLAAGALPPPVRVSVVDAIPSGPAGKRPLVVAPRPHRE